MNINKYIQESVNSMDFDETFQKAIKDKIDATIKDVVKDQMDPWSDFGKGMKERFKKEVGFDFSRVSFHSFANFVIDQCNEVVSDLMSEKNAELIKKHLAEKVVSYTRKEVQFADLCQEIEQILTETIKEEYEEDCCADLKFNIVCKEEDRGMTYQIYEFSIYKGEVEHYNRMCSFRTMREEVFSYRSDSHRSPFDKMFSGFKFMKTKIKGIEDYEVTLDQDVLY